MSAEPARPAKVTPLHVLACNHCGCTLPDLAAKMQELEDKVAGQATQLRSSAALLARKSRELEEIREDEPNADTIKGFLDYAKTEWRKTSRWDISARSDRWRITRTQLAKPAYDESVLRDCVDYITRHPWTGGNGRSAAPYPGARRMVDTEYAYGTDKRINAALEWAATKDLLEPLKVPDRTSRPLHWVLYTIQTQHKVPIRKTGQRGRYLTECPICKAEDMLVQEFGSSATFVRLTCPQGCNEQAIEFAYEVQDRVFSVPGVNERRRAA